MRRLHVLALIALTAVVVLGSVGGASAAPTDPFVFKGSFDSVSGPFSGAGSIAVDHVTGNVLVSDPVEGTISKFDANGNPVDFDALGSPTITGVSIMGKSAQRVFIDNSGGPNQGTIYAFSVMGQIRAGFEYLWVFKPNGEPLLAQNPRKLREPSVFPQGKFTNDPWNLGMTLSPNGNPWIWWEDIDSKIEYLGETSPVLKEIGTSKPIVGVDRRGGSTSSGFMISDSLGHLYLPGPKSLNRYSSNANFANEGETGLPAVDGGYLAVDPSTNDVYQRFADKISAIHYSDPLVKATPFEAISGVRGGGGIDFDPTGQTLYVAEGSEVGIFHREPPSVPLVSHLIAEEMRSSTVELYAEIAARGALTSFHLEYGTTTAYGQSTPETPAPWSFFSVDVGAAIQGLQPDTTYHVRLVATNSAGTTYGPDRTFKTYPLPTGGTDPCRNALARKQTSAQRLPDCRAYELVSAPDTGGYDVESYLAPGQTPFPGFPLAEDKLLYAAHSGAIPGPWNATNHGPDPYLASRTPNGWSTDYKGLPANLNPQAGSFSSVLGEADSQLSTLAFAGPNLCDPCFTSGLKTGIPLRLPNGQLVQGMTGSLAGSVDPSAKPEGKVAKYFSQDGKHLLFASKYAFEPGANTGGDLTVYDRNLATGTTQIVSTDQAGNPLTGTVSGLDVSADGSRIVTATKTGEDAQGNELTHPYMHIGSSPNSVDLAPNATAGVLYAGMSQDGSKLFFTSTDPLTAEDTDNSADLYEAALDGSGNLDLNVIAEPDTDACNPVANLNGEHWNTGSSTADCSAVAISGGGGVASATGAIYFLSPEQLEGSKGTLDQPNLYLAQPGGSPTFLATLEPDNPLVLDSVKANAVRRTGDFQTTPNGNYAVFTTNRELTGVDYSGFRSIFRYDVATGQIACPSCETTGAIAPSLSEDLSLALNGLSLLADGRVFFTTKYPLALSDANGLKDVYQWSEGKQRLISSGIGRFDSALLTASADGTDVYFFTHDTLAPEEDHNGALMKIYDAREGGGFFKLPTAVPCQASDECHGPGTPAGFAPDIRSSGKTTTGNVLVCPKNRVKKRGQCVKKPAQRKKKKHAKKKGAAKKRHAGADGKRGGRNA